MWILRYNEFILLSLSQLSSSILCWLAWAGIPATPLLGWKRGRLEETLGTKSFDKKLIVSQLGSGIPLVSPICQPSWTNAVSLKQAIEDELSYRRLFCPSLKFLPIFWRLHLSILLTCFPNSEFQLVNDKRQQDHHSLQLIGMKWFNNTDARFPYLPESSLNLVELLLFWCGF